MTHTTQEFELRGCAPTPLAHYLKALGILRLVAEQADPQAQGWWQHDTFWLRSTLGEDDLLSFFADDYSPTPLVTPWNGGSGFYPKDNDTAITAITEGDAVRFGQYRKIIGLCRSLIDELDLSEKPEGDGKPQLLQICRNRFPDDALLWLDAAYVLTEDGPKYPPLLGTGGNDGRLEFTNNFMQHLLTIMSVNGGEVVSSSRDSLAESLFADISCVRESGTIGQFDPGNLGGFNNGTGFEGTATVNAWDYVLMLEGAIAFAAASTKKLDSASSGVLAYPFCVRPAGIGYESAATTDEGDARAEMWLPLWDSPTTFPAISTLLSEGRVEMRHRKARSGVDFARAIATLGVDRGITEFERFGFHQRNGLAYFAVPLGRFTVRSSPGAEELLNPLDRWLDRFRRAATGKTAPARAGRALRAVEGAILQWCQRGNKEDVQRLLIALGEAESTVAISSKLRDGEMGSGVPPLPLLSPKWLKLADDETPEFRLAAALASVWHEQVGPMRRHLEPINLASRSHKWADAANDPAMVWGGGDLVRNLTAVLARRLIDVLREGKEKAQSDLLAPLNGRCWATLEDVHAFIRSDVDDRRIEALLKGLMLLDWRKVGPDHRPKLSSSDASTPDAAYALLKLCHLPRPLDDKTIKLSPQIARRALAGDLHGATTLAARRLRVSGIPPAIEAVYGARQRSLRIAAALMFPTSQHAVGKLQTLVEARHLRDGPDNASDVETANA